MFWLKLSEFAVMLSGRIGFVNGLGEDIRYLV